MEDVYQIAGRDLQDVAWPPAARSAHSAAFAAGSLLLVIVLAGCGAFPHQRASQVAGPGQAIPVGSSTHAISVGGTSRTFLVYRPATLPTAAPLVVMLHGGFGSGTQAEKSYHWDSEADTGHFVVAYPDGLNRAWNTGGGCCGVPGRTNADDLGFITAMVSAIEHEVPIDPSRVYATGISNGGIMAYTLACHTTIFAAIGPDSATELGSCPARRRSPSSTSTAPPIRTSPTTAAWVTGGRTSTGRRSRPSTPPGAAPATAPPR